MKHIAHIIFTVLFYLNILAGGGQNVDAVKFYKKGAEYYKEEKIEDAIKAIKKAIKIDKNFTEAHAKLAEIYMGMDSPVKKQLAETEIKRAIKGNEGNFEFLFKLGKIYQKQRFTYKARDYFEGLAEKFPDKTELLIELGRIHTGYFEKYNGMLSSAGYDFSGYAEKQYKKVAALCQRIVQLVSNKELAAHLWHRLGHIYFVAKQFKESEASLRKALDAQATHVSSYNLLAYLYATQEHKLD